MEQFEAFLGVNPWTALFTLLNFLLVLYVGKRFLYGPVTEIIQARQKEIDDMYAQASEAERTAHQLQEEYRDKLSKAQEDSERIVKEAVARAQSREDEIISQAQKESATLMQKAEAAIALERAKALNDAKDEISGIAMSIAEKVVGRQMNEEDHSQLIDSFIDRLGE